MLLYLLNPPASHLNLHFRSCWHCSPLGCLHLSLSQTVSHCFPQSLLPEDYFLDVSLILLHLPLVLILPWASQVAQWVETQADAGLTPGLRRSPGGAHGNPLQYSCLENPMERGAWWDSVRRATKSQTQLTDCACTGTTSMAPFDRGEYLTELVDMMDLGILPYICPNSPPHSPQDLAPSFTFHCLCP